MAILSKSHMDASVSNPAHALSEDEKATGCVEEQAIVFQQDDVPMEIIIASPTDTTSLEEMADEEENSITRLVQDAHGIVKGTSGLHVDAMHADVSMEDFSAVGQEKAVASVEALSACWGRPQGVVAEPAAEGMTWSNRDSFLLCDGCIPAGDDILVARMSISQAMTQCKELRGCQGFTFCNDSQAEEPVVFFKSRWALLPMQGNAWTSCKYVEARACAGQFAADLLVHGALQPHSRVDFPQITEICERLEKHPEEIGAVVALLGGALRRPENFKTKLKALTIANEMLYNSQVVSSFRSADGFVSAIERLRMICESGLGASVDADIKMFATEIGKMLVDARDIEESTSSPSSTISRNSRNFRRLASDMGGSKAVKEIERTTSKIKVAAATAVVNAKAPVDSVHSALKGALKAGSVWFDEITSSTLLSTVSSTNMHDETIDQPVFVVAEAAGGSRVERQRQVPSIDVRGQWQRRPIFL